MTQKQSFTLTSDFLKYILRFNAWIFLVKLNIGFCQIFLSIFHSVMSLRQIVGKITKLSMTQYLFFCICPCTSCMPKFWHAYVIIYVDFIVIFEPCIILLFSMNSASVSNSAIFTFSCMALTLLDTFDKKLAPDYVELEVLFDLDNLVDSFDDLPFELLPDDFDLFHLQHLSTNFYV